ncbi:MAG: flagellar protein FlaG [Planctomycetota bacterium]
MADQVTTQLQGPALRSAELAARVARSGQPAASPAVQKSGRAPEKPQEAQEAQRAASAAPPTLAGAEEQAQEQQAALPEAPDAKALMEALDSINGVMEHLNKSIRFAVDDTSDQLYAQIVNTDTNEVIKTVPSQAVLKMMARFDEMLGILIDEHI